MYILLLPLSTNKTVERAELSVLMLRTASVLTTATHEYRGRIELLCVALSYIPEMSDEELTRNDNLS